MTTKLLIDNELHHFVDEYCLEKGYNDSPAYALLEGKTACEVANIIDEFNK